MRRLQLMDRVVEAFQESMVRKKAREEKAFLLHVERGRARQQQEKEKEEKEKNKKQLFPQNHHSPLLRKRHADKQGNIKSLQSVSISVLKYTVE